MEIALPDIPWIQSIRNSSPEFAHCRLATKCGLPHQLPLASNWKHPRSLEPMLCTGLAASFGRCQQRVLRPRHCIAHVLYGGVWQTCWTYDFRSHRGMHLGLGILLDWSRSWLTWVSCVSSNGLLEADRNHSEKYFVRAGAWCWVSQAYETERLALHYFCSFTHISMFRSLTSLLRGVSRPIRNCGNIHRHILHAPTQDEAIVCPSRRTR